MTLLVPAIVIMGVSGCGKTTLGQSLARATGYRFVEGDTLHLPESIAKMSHGVALTDEDRWPWLERVADALKTNRAESLEGEYGAIVSCSALKRAYRDFLRSRLGDRVLFVFPAVSPDIVRERLLARPDHYMPASLIDSQMATLELPDLDEPVLTVDAEINPDQLVALILDRLRLPDQLSVRALPH